MAQYTYKCSCGASATSSEGSAIGRVKEDTGFFAVFTYRGTFVWLCPKCYNESVVLARRLTQICGDDHISISSFLRRRSPT